MPSASFSAVSKLSARRAGDIRADDDAVDHHFDVVLDLLVEGRRVLDVVELAVDLDALEALAHQVVEFALVLALAAARDRRQQVEPRLLRAAP